MKLEWEEISHSHSGYLYRAKIFGGWLVRYCDDVETLVDERMLSGRQWRNSITFVPDAFYEWDI